MTTNYDPIDDECNVFDTLSFNINNRTRIGHLLSLSFTNSGKDLTAKMEVADPTDPANSVKIVGPFSHIAWQGKDNNPVIASFRVTSENRALLRSALLARDGGAEAEVEFEIYEYDFNDKKFFKSFSCDGKKIKCVLTEGTSPYIGTEPMGDIKDPVTFAVRLSLTGKCDGAKQQLIIATSTTDKHNCDFGTVAT